VALLGPTDPLPPSSRRFLITGASGSGKSTLREAISTLLGLPTVELDSLHHGPKWTIRPSFIDDVDRFSSATDWVTEWQYSSVKPLLLSRSDVLVWLDHARWTVMHRVVRRTLRRRLFKQQLWNGNYEPPLRTLFTDPEHIIRWSWGTYQRRRREALDVALTHDRPAVVQLSGQREVDTWMRGPLAALAPARKED
jgi:adenylate kinase family enzyme